MPKRRVPPNDPSDPAIRALTEKVLSLFAERCAVFKIDPGSKDFWRLMSCAFAFEHLLAECKPPAKAKKPVRWTPSEKKDSSKALGKWWLAVTRSKVRSKRSSNAFPASKKAS